MRIVKLPKAEKTENGSAYQSKLKCDYGIPTLRLNTTYNETNGALRNGLTKPQLKKMKVFNAQLKGRLES